MRVKKYKDPIVCPVCKKVFGEWEKVDGEAVIKKWCPRCKEYRFIGGKGLVLICHFNKT